MNYQETETVFAELKDVVARLRAEDGCPWDRAQTHATLKAPCIEEAAEVIGGINILAETGKADNLKEELGDLLLQIIFHAQLASEEGLFDIGDVAETAAGKMIRRHPHVFGGAPRPVRNGASEAEMMERWEEIKRGEKAGREWEKAYLPGALDEAERLIGAARRRKGIVSDSPKTMADCSIIDP